MEMLSKQSEDVQIIIKSKNFAEEDLKTLKESEKSYKNRKSILKQIDKELEEINNVESLSEAERQIHNLEKNLSQLEDSDTANLADRNHESEGKATRSDQEKSKETGSEDIQGEQEDEKNGTDTEDNSRPSSGANHEDQTGRDKKESHDEASRGQQEDDHGSNTKSPDDSNVSSETKLEGEFTEEEAQNMLEGTPQEVLDDIEDRSKGYEQKIEIKEKIRGIIISSLEDNFGREKLEEASTRDLIKLRSEIKEKETDSKVEEPSGKSTGKDKEEIEKEAEEDLQMLMGAGLADSQSEEDSSYIPGIESLKDQIRDKVSGGTEEKEGTNDHERMNSGQVLNLLEEYRELPEREATVKTAHVMKGYLEYAKKVDRELTYSELANNLDSSREDEEKLAKYFNRISKSEYTGNVSIDSEEFIDTSVNLVRRL
jgi:hypothetical protein